MRTRKSVQKPRESGAFVFLASNCGRSDFSATACSGTSPQVFLPTAVIQSVFKNLEGLCALRLSGHCTNPSDLRSYVVERSLVAPPIP